MKILLILLLFSVTGHSQVFVTPNNGTNPIIPDLIADPSITKLNGIYYCYVTTDGYGAGLATAGPPVVWSSTDFVHWSFEGISFPSAARHKYWAPSKVIKVKDQYYLYPTVNNNICAAVAASPTGPFRLLNGADTLLGATAPRPMVQNEGPRGTKGIDAEVFVDDNGQAYMYWAQRGAAPLNADMVTLDTAVTVIITKREGYSEGPIVFKRNGIYYYCYTLAGHENYQYAYGYSRVSPLGPFTFPEQDIITTTDHRRRIYGPGHGSVFTDESTGRYYFAYLEFGNGGTNRQVWVDQLEFNSDGTIKPLVLTNKGVGRLSKTKPVNSLIDAATISASSVKPDFQVQPIKDASLSRRESYEPVNAIDASNRTRWMAAVGDQKPWVIVDLGAEKEIERTEVFFSKPTAGHAYLLEYSADGSRWMSAGGHADLRVQSPHTDHFTAKARFLKLSILQGEPGIWEFNIYGVRPALIVR